MNMSLVDTIETLKKNGDIHFLFALISILNVLLAPILNNQKNGMMLKNFYIFNLVTFLKELLQEKN
jgi:hypothetical protein